MMYSYIYGGKCVVIHPSDNDGPSDVYYGVHTRGARGGRPQHNIVYAKDDKGTLFEPNHFLTSSVGKADLGEWDPSLAKGWQAYCEEGGICKPHSHHRGRAKRMASLVEAWQERSGGEGSDIDRKSGDEVNPNKRSTAQPSTVGKYYPRTQIIRDDTNVDKDACRIIGKAVYLIISTFSRGNLNPTKFYGKTGYKYATIIESAMYEIGYRVLPRILFQAYKEMEELDEYVMHMTRCKSWKMDCLYRLPDTEDSVGSLIINGLTIAAAKAEIEKRLQRSTTPSNPVSAAKHQKTAINKKKNKNVVEDTPPKPRSELKASRSLQSPPRSEVAKNTPASKLSETNKIESSLAPNSSSTWMLHLPRSEIPATRELAWSTT